jgi:Ca2+-binding EF-hand superfamily protein
MNDRHASMRGDESDILRKHVQSRFLDSRDTTRINVKKAFAMFDTDMCGFIDMSDFKRIVCAWGIDEHNVAVQEIFKRCDKDNKGYYYYYYCCCCCLS